LKDLNGREIATFVPLILLAVWIGLYPSPFLRRLESSVARVIERVNPDYRPVNASVPPPAPAAGGR
jgi:NADH-quinone oxidoreductase subunit M